MLNKIPSSFVIAGNTITVTIVDKIEGDLYGEFDDSLNNITVARTVKGNLLNSDQLLTTFYHEVIHVFQFFYDNEFIESQAQCYANFILEYLKTRE